jgi:hypothetical protein
MSATNTPVANVFWVCALRKWVLRKGALPRRDTGMAYHYALRFLPDYTPPRPPLLFFRENTGGGFSYFLLATYYHLLLYMFLFYHPIYLFLFSKNSVDIIFIRID